MVAALVRALNCARLLSLRDLDILALGLAMALLFIYNWLTIFAFQFFKRLLPLIFLSW